MPLGWPCSPRTEGPAGTASLSAWPRYVVLPCQILVALRVPPALPRVPRGTQSVSPQYSLADNEQVLATILFGWR